jgi:carboxyl-terminal processing protease
MEYENNKPKKTIDKLISNLIPKALFVILVFAFGIWVGQNVALPFGGDRGPIFSVLNKKAPNKITVDFDPFWETWEAVTTDYLERTKIDPQKLLYGAIGGMVDAVGDPYTVFLDPDQNREFELSLSGTYEGVGIELDVRNDQLVVVAPIEGTPAQKAGVASGDKILEIDGISTATLTIQESVQKMRGAAGTSVVLRLQRDKRAFDVKLTRAKITLKSVEFEDLGGGIAKLKIIRFGDNTLSQWNEAVNKVVAGGFTKVILDLRNNPGGRLDHSISVAGDFVAKGSVILQQEKASGKKQPFRSSEEAKLLDTKVTVLINKGSASASEIVAGALRDLRSVKLVGETTFGKGTIQTVADISEGAGLHITIAKWLTPDGTWVNQKGLKPDIEVKLTEEDIEADRDPQLDRAKRLLQ